MRRSAAIAIVCGMMILFVAAATVKPKGDQRLRGSFRRPTVNGWTVVHLEGTPAEIGFQHGYLLAPEIRDLEKVYQLELTHDTGKDWNFLREAGKTVLWPHVEAENREKMQGIADGATAHGVNVDIWDVVALNAAMEWSYYVAEFDKVHKIA